MINQEKRKKWLDLIGKDEREVKKIERARAKRDARFFDDWFDKYNKPVKRSEYLSPEAKRHKDEWL